MAQCRIKTLCNYCAGHSNTFFVKIYVNYKVHNKEIVLKALLEDLKLKKHKQQT